MSTYPEHEKLATVKNQSQPQGELLQWIGDRGILLCRWNDDIDAYVPIARTTSSLLAEYHEIDLDRLEQEKRRMLEDL